MDANPPKISNGRTRQTLPFDGPNVTVVAEGDTVVLRTTTAPNGSALEAVLLVLFLVFWTSMASQFSSSHDLNASSFFGLHTLFFLGIVPCVLVYAILRNFPFPLRMTIGRDGVVLALMFGSVALRRRRWALADVHAFDISAGGYLGMELAKRTVRLGRAAKDLEVRDVAEVLDDQLRLFQGQARASQ